ncbi:hypothetical protein IE81DRAFT_338858 [Ceraceosorus guamensis]|uniref:Uncharacterized protein n=1 Tax=Ceraceosorus guamensis TaxID=1522189 RepID=A0A316WFD9_9BASI|nr:hypothetical protein IE81DRAFT_338858 [Ceraceosorus guamensis]PWN45995.1 hypothetical protein IE81DRAFT_338858 [Ceraceosorus guamensis]
MATLIKPLASAEEATVQTSVNTTIAASSASPVAMPALSSAATSGPPSPQVHLIVLAPSAALPSEKSEVKSSELRPILTSIFGPIAQQLKSLHPTAKLLYSIVRYPRVPQSDPGSSRTALDVAQLDEEWQSDSGYGNSPSPGQASRRVETRQWKEWTSNSNQLEPLQAKDLAQRFDEGAESSRQAWYVELNDLLLGNSEKLGPSDALWGLVRVLEHFKETDPTGTLPNKTISLFPPTGRVAARHVLHLCRADDSLHIQGSLPRPGRSASEDWTLATVTEALRSLKVQFSTIVVPASRDAGKRGECDAERLHASLAPTRPDGSVDEDQDCSGLEAHSLLGAGLSKNLILMLRGLAVRSAASRKRSRSRASPESLRSDQAKRLKSAAAPTAGSGASTTLSGLPVAGPLGQPDGGAPQVAGTNTTSMNAAMIQQAAAAAAAQAAALIPAHLPDAHKAILRSALTRLMFVQQQQATMIRNLTITQRAEAATASKERQMALERLRAKLVAAHEAITAQSKALGSGGGPPDVQKALAALVHISQEAESMGVHLGLSKQVLAVAAKVASGQSAPSANGSAPAAAPPQQPFQASATAPAQAVNEANAKFGQLGSDSAIRGVPPPDFLQATGNATAAPAQASSSRPTPYWSGPIVWSVNDPNNPGMKREIASFVSASANSRTAKENLNLPWPARLNLGSMTPLDMPALQAYVGTRQTPAVLFTPRPPGQASPGEPDVPAHNVKAYEMLASTLRDRKCCALIPHGAPGAGIVLVPMPTVAAQMTRLLGLVFKEAAPLQALASAASTGASKQVGTQVSGRPFADPSLEATRPPQMPMPAQSGHPSGQIPPVQQQPTQRMGSRPPEAPPSNSLQPGPGAGIHSVPPAQGPGQGPMPAQALFQPPPPPSNQAPRPAAISTTQAPQHGPRPPAAPTSDAPNALQAQQAQMFVQRQIAQLQQARLQQQQQQRADGLPAPHNGGAQQHQQPQPQQMGQITASIPQMVQFLQQQVASQQGVQPQQPANMGQFSMPPSNFPTQPNWNFGGNQNLGQVQEPGQPSNMGSVHAAPMSGDFNLSSTFAASGYGPPSQQGAPGKVPWNSSAVTGGQSNAGGVTPADVAALAAQLGLSHAAFGAGNQGNNPGVSMPPQQQPQQQQPFAGTQFPYKSQAGPQGMQTSQQQPTGMWPGFSQQPQQQQHSAASLANVGLTNEMLQRMLGGAQ